jgi:hypothetical protein
MGVDSPLSRFGLGPLDGERHEVDAPGFVAFSCQIQQVFTGAAAHVQNAATNLACFGQFDNVGLGPTGIPRGLALVHLLEIVAFHRPLLILLAALCQAHPSPGEHRQC